MKFSSLASQSRREGGPHLFGYNPESKAISQVTDTKDLVAFFDQINPQISEVTPPY
jgi:hypothetical protein